MLEGWYDERMRPPRFVASALMQEMLISYKLLVLFDRDARKVYRDALRPKLQGRLFDPELDALCLARRRRFYHELADYVPAPLLPGPRRLPDRETFYAPSEFPLLAPRLALIERFMDSIQPSRISSLWRDKRDILRWYTFWAVVILGGINLLAALAQIGLGGAQVHYAKLSLDAGNGK